MSISRLEMIKRAADEDYRIMMEDLEAEENDGENDEELVDKGDDW